MKMVKALLSYMLRDYIRSYRYVICTLFYLVMMNFLYSMKPCYVVDSYAMSSVLVYISAVWLALGFIDIEDAVQQQITILHTRNQSIYYLCKIAFIYIFVTILSIIAVFYPIFRGFFNRNATLSDVIFAIISHLILGLLGISIAILFNSRLIRDRRWALMGLLSVILVSIVQGALINKIPFLKFPVLLFPPVYFFLAQMYSVPKNYLLNFMNTKLILLIFAAMLVYSVILLLTFIKLMKKKAF